MTETNETERGPWHEWNGGEMPVPEGTLVDVRHRDGDDYFDRRAGLDTICQLWSRYDHPHLPHPGDIVAFRPVDHLHYSPAERRERGTLSWYDPDVPEWAEILLEARGGEDRLFAEELSEGSRAWPRSLGAVNDGFNLGFDRSKLESLWRVHSRRPGRHHVGQNDDSKLDVTVSLFPREWVASRDELPPAGEEVLASVRSGGGRFCDLAMFHPECGWHSPQLVGLDDFLVTHWRHLPPHPEADEGGE